MGGRKDLLTVYHFFIILWRVIIGCYIHLETSLCGLKKKELRPCKIMFFKFKINKKNNVTYRTFPRVQCAKHVKRIKMWKPYTFHYIILQLSLISFWYKSNYCSEHNSIHFLYPAPALQLQSTSIQINHAEMAIPLHQE